MKEDGLAAPNSSEHERKGRFSGKQRVFLFAFQTVAVSGIMISATCNETLLTFACFAQEEFPKMIHRLSAKMLYRIFLIFIVLLFSWTGFSSAQEKGLSDMRNRLVQDVDIYMRIDSVFVSDDLDSAWMGYKNGNESDSILFSVVHSLGERLVLRGQHVAVASLFGTAETYFSEIEGDEKYSYLMRLKTAMGAIYEEMGLWNRAMDLYFDVLGLREISHREDSYGGALNNIGNVYFKQGFYDKAKFYYDSAIAFNTAAGYKRELVNNYNNLAGLYYAAGDYEKTLDALNSALMRIDRKMEPDLYYLVWQNMAVVYNEEGKNELAEELIRDVIDYQKEVGRNFDKIQSLLLLADIIHRKKLDSACMIASAAVQQAHCFQNRALEVKALNALCRYEDLRGDYESAYKHMVRAVRLQDSLETLDIRMKIASIEATYQIEQESQAKDLALQKMQIERLQSQKQEVVLIALSFCLVIALGVMYYRYRLQKKLKRETEELSMQKQALFEKEKEMADQREKELRDSLELKNKELTSKVLHLVRNNEFIVDINRELQQLLLELNPKDTAKKEHIREMLVKLRAQGNEGTYEEFKYYFEQVHQSFYENLQKAYPSLTYKDIRLCSFLKLGLSSKEIASITFKEVRSVESARNRLRKKMELEADVNLIDFFAKF